MTDPYADLAGRFVAHYETLRGAVRAELVAGQLDGHLPGSGRVADVGGGAGRQALRLARLGYEVTLLDPSDAIRRKGEPPRLSHEVIMASGGEGRSPPLDCRSSRRSQWRS